MEHRYDELSAQLGLPEVLNDREKYQQAGKALSDLETPVMKYRELKQVKRLPNWRRASRFWKRRSRFCCCPRTPTTRRT